MAQSPGHDPSPADRPRCPWCGAPMRERDPVELARLHLPSRDWSALVCDRCERGAKVHN